MGVRSSILAVETSDVGWQVHIAYSVPLHIDNSPSNYQAILAAVFFVRAFSFFLYKLHIEHEVQLLIIDWHQRLVSPVKLWTFLHLI